MSKYPRMSGMTAKKAAGKWGITLRDRFDCFAQMGVSPERFDLAMLGSFFLMLKSPRMDAVIEKINKALGAL